MVWTVKVLIRTDSIQLVHNVLAVKKYMSEDLQLEFEGDALSHKHVRSLCSRLCCTCPILTAVALQGSGIPDRVSLVTLPGAHLRTGKELCITYGGKSNEELLFLYGALPLTRILRLQCCQAHDIEGQTLVLSAKVHMPSALSGTPICVQALRWRTMRMICSWSSAHCRQQSSGMISSEQGFSSCWIRACHPSCSFQPSDYKQTQAVR